VRRLDAAFPSAGTDLRQPLSPASFLNAAASGTVTSKAIPTSKASIFASFPKN